MAASMVTGKFLDKLVLCLNDTCTPDDFLLHFIYVRALARCLMTTKLFYCSVLYDTSQHDRETVI